MYICIYVYVCIYIEIMLTLRFALEHGPGFNSTANWPRDQDDLESQCHRGFSCHPWTLFDHGLQTLTLWYIISHSH